MWYNALQGLVHNPSIPQQMSIISMLHSLHPILHNVKSGVLFLYARNKPSNELEFHRFIPRLCLQGRPSSVADFTMLEIHYFWSSRILQHSKYTISGCRRFCSARNTLFLAAAGFAALEIHYFWLSQVLQCPKYTISDCRRFYNARNTLFLVAADFAMPEIHYFWPPRILQRPKYIISGCRRFYNARNTLFLAAADFKGAEIHYFWPSQICNNPSLCSTPPPTQDNAQLATGSP